MTRERVESNQEDLLELWNNLYFKGNSTEFTDGETYTHIEKINDSDMYDGQCWYYILQRESDGKFFRFHIWEASKDYIIEDEYLEEVFEKQTVTYE